MAKPTEIRVILTPKQEDYEADKGESITCGEMHPECDVYHPNGHEAKDKPTTSRAMEARNFYRRQAGWPPLRVK